MMGPVVTHLLLGLLHAHVPTKSPHRHTQCIQKRTPYYSVCGAVVVCFCVLVSVRWLLWHMVHVMIWPHTSHKTSCLSSPRCTQCNYMRSHRIQYNYTVHAYCFCPAHITQCTYCTYIETHRLHIN